MTPDSNRCRETSTKGDVRRRRRTFRPGGHHGPAGPRGTVNAELESRLTVAGTLDQTTLDELRRRMITSVRESGPYLAIDLAGVTRCRANPFPVLVEAYLETRDRDGWLRLVGLGDTLLDLLEDASLREVMVVYLASQRPGDAARADRLIAAAAMDPDRPRPVRPVLTVLGRPPASGRGARRCH